jgi:hypothetical protein
MLGHDDTLEVKKFRLANLVAIVTVVTAMATACCWESLNEDTRSSCAAFLTAKHLGRLFATSRGGRALVAYDAAWETVFVQYGVMPVAGLTPARGAAMKRWVQAELIVPPSRTWMDGFRRCRASDITREEERHKPGSGLACDPGIAAALSAGALAEWDHDITAAWHPAIRALVDALQKESLESDARRRERGAPRIWAVVECVRNGFVINETTMTDQLTDSERPPPSRRWFHHLSEWGRSEYGARYEISACVRGEFTLHFRGEFYHLIDVWEEVMPSHYFTRDSDTGAHIIGELSVVEHGSERPSKKPRRRAAREARRLLTTSHTPAAPAGTVVASPDVPQGATRVIRFDCTYSDSFEVPPQSPRECDGAALDALAARIVGSAVPRAVGAELLWRLLCGPAMCGFGLMGPDFAGRLEERMASQEWGSALQGPLRRVFPIHAITATGEEADAATGAELPLDALWPSSDDDPFGSCEEMVPSQRLNDDFDSMNGNPEMCPGGHGLEYARTNTVGVTWCDVCQERLPLESDAHGCAECDWHVCHACWQTCQDEKPPASRTRGRSARRPDATNTPPVHEGMQSGNSESGSDLDEPG